MLHSSPKEGRDASVPVQRQSGKKRSLISKGGSAFLIYSGLQLIGRGPPHYRGQAAFLSLQI